MAESGEPRARFGSAGSVALFLYRWKPRRVAAALALLAAFTLGEGLGLVSLAPMLGSLGLDTGKGTLGSIAGWFGSLTRSLGLESGLLPALAGFALLGLLQPFLVRRQSLFNLSLQHDLAAHLRERVYRAISGSSWLFFVKSRSSDITQVLTAEVDRAGAASYQLLSLAGSGAAAAVGLWLSLRISSGLTLLVLAAGGGLALALRRRARAARAAGEELSVALRGLYAGVDQHLGGMKTARSHGAEDRHLEIFRALIDRVRHVYLRAMESQTRAKCWFDAGSVLVLCAILYLSREVFSQSSGEALLLVFLSARIMPRLSSLLQGWQSFVSLAPAFDSVLELEARCLRSAEPRAPREEVPPLREGIRLERVYFGYGAAPVIHGLELAIPAGETTFLGGPSGAGKSTVADLVIGLMSPQAGRVLIDGLPLSEARRRAWQERIGYVGQETFLFHDTIRANLLWARPGAPANEVREALRLAAAEGFVDALPEGLDTVVGDRGARLSGGERQRLALARALLRKPDLLVLDEATSQLDRENELRIEEAVEGLRGRLTVLVISHRISWARRADSVLHLERGRLVEPASSASSARSEEGRSARSRTDRLSPAKA
jgi:ATP-binding cassette subfamily C protein